MILNLLTASLYLLPVSAGNTDSVTAPSEPVSWRLLSAVSGSLTGATNWRGAGYRSFSFNGNAVLIYRKSGKHWYRSHSGHWDLGFTRFQDSLWQKHADQLRLQLLWCKDSGSGRHSITVSGRTQLLDSYQYYYDSFKDQTIRQWSGTFMNPAELEAGYGFCWRIPNTGTVNLAIATLRLRNEPHYQNQSSRAYIDYGCSLQALFIRPLGKYSDWYFSGRFFLNGAGRDQIVMDALNRITFKVWKFFQLRLESRVVYEPLFSYRLQYRNEILAGLFFDLGNKEEKKK
jgi:hypothetical protein